MRPMTRKVRCCCHVLSIRIYINGFFLLLFLMAESCNKTSKYWSPFSKMEILLEILELRQGNQRSRLASHRRALPCFFSAYVRLNFKMGALGVQSLPQQALVQSITCQQHHIFHWMSTVLQEESSGDLLHFRQQVELFRRLRDVVSQAEVSTQVLEAALCMQG